MRRGVPKRLHHDRIALDRLAQRLARGGDFQRLAACHPSGIARVRAAVFHLWPSKDCRHGGSPALSLLEQKPPRKDELAGLAIIALGVVIGFPLLTSLALQHMTAARGLLYVALLPVMTVLFAVLLAGERLRPPFWFFSLAASLLVMDFAFTTGRVFGTLPGDLMMLAVIVLCGLGSAKGGRLSRRLGGWQVISWSLLMTQPAMLPLALAD